MTEDAAIDMIAQHILTLPVFEARSSRDTTSRAATPSRPPLDSLRSDFGEFGLENEIRDTAPFYESTTAPPASRY